MDLRARIPAIPERRSEQTPARLARKVGPIFGVSPDAERGTRGPWLGDYTRVTLTEIMRGAPTPAKRLAGKVKGDRGVAQTDDMAPIANATAARFGPDTKAAFVLTGANVLFEPICAALLKALAGFRARHEAIARCPDLLIGAYAYIVTELFRSEPALLQAAVQAQTVQRALTAVQGAPISTGGLDSFAAHEWGWPEASEHTEAPTDLAILDELARDLSEQLQDYLLPTSPDDEQVPPVRRLRRAIVGVTIATLLDLSKNQLDAGLRMVESPSGRRADLLIDFEQRARLFAYSIVPHVRSRSADAGGARFPDPDNGDEVLSVLGELAPAPITRDDLTDRANLTVYAGLLEGYLALFGSRRLRHVSVWHRQLRNYADAVARVAGEGSAEHLLAELRAVTALIQYATDNDDAFTDEFPTVRAMVERALELAGRLQENSDGGQIGSGPLYPVVNTLLGALQRIRKRRVRANRESLPDAEWLNEILASQWSIQLDRLGQFFAPASRQYLVRLHNYAAFLVGPGATLQMLEDGDALFDGENSLIEARRSAAGGGETLLGPAMRGVRHTVQAAICGWVDFAWKIHQQDPARAAELLAKADRYAVQVEEYLASLGEQRRSAAAVLDAEYRDLELRVSLGYLYQTKAELQASAAEREELSRLADEHLRLVRAAAERSVGYEPVLPIELPLRDGRSAEQRAELAGLRYG